MPENSTAPFTADVPRNLKPYFLCLLRKGPEWDNPQGHEDLMLQQLAYLRRQAEAGNILLAGPALGHTQNPSDDVTGITIVRAETLINAQKIVNEDPAVQTGRLIVELRPVLLPSLDAVHVEYQ
jgi:uncharacterized protein YciI